MAQNPLFGADAGAVLPGRPVTIRTAPLGTRLSWGRFAAWSPLFGLVLLCNAILALPSLRGAVAQTRQALWDNDVRLPWERRTFEG